MPSHSSLRLNPNNPLATVAHGPCAVYCWQKDILTAVFNIQSNRLHFSAVTKIHFFPLSQYSCFITHPPRIITRPIATKIACSVAVAVYAVSEHGSDILHSWDSPCRDGTPDLYRHYTSTSILLQTGHVYVPITGCIPSELSA